MQRAIQHIVYLTVFDDPAGIHHGYIICKTRHNREVVRNSNQRRPGFLAELLYFVQDLGLDRDV